MSLLYKFSEEKFYDDFTNMKTVYQSHIHDKEIDDNQINTEFYYKFKVENETNFLLLEIPKINHNNFILL